MTPTVTIIKKEFIHITRDPNMVRLLLLMPILQLLLLGYVVSSEVRNIPAVICDLDRSRISREITDKIRHSGYFILSHFESDESKLHLYLDSGEAAIAIVFPRDLSRNLGRSRPTEIQILMDGVDSNTSTIALGYVEGILQDFLEEQRKAVLSQTGLTAGAPLIVPVTRIWYNQALEYKNFMIPALMVFLLTMVTAIISAMGLVREKEIGTLDQLMVSPVKKHELLIGKIIPFAVVGFIELALALVFARLWYRIPIQGSLALFALFVAVFLLTSLGMGLFVSASAHTQQQAMFMTFFFIFFFMLMSGFMFQIENMPRPAQVLSYLDPMRYLVTVTREIFIKGADMRHLYMQGVALAVFGTGIFSVAVLRFQKRLR